jgi:hypothetical protein
MIEKSDGITSAEGSKHVDCISDFCGNDRNPGFWADIFQRPNGTSYVSLGGGWMHYHATAPCSIEDSDPIYVQFLKACEADVEIQFLRDNF